MKVERVVIDINVLISAALSAHSAPARITYWVLEHRQLLFSAATFAELETRLWWPKFDRYISPEIRRSLLHDFKAAAIWVELPAVEHLSAYSRDPDDDKFIHTALAGSVPWLISGDKDLLDVSPIEGLRIVSPAQSLASFGIALRQM